MSSRVGEPEPTDPGALVRGVGCACAVAAGDDERLGLAPAGVAQLEGLLERREAPRRRVPRVGVRVPVDPSELSDAQRLEGGGLRSRGAVVPALGGEQRAEAREDRLGVIQADLARRGHLDQRGGQARRERVQQGL
ncbi:MAG: hypothetical protein ACXWZZ_08690, partial [Solirubrobacteraceae bacterium]